MIHTVNHNVTTAEGAQRNIIIEPVLTHTSSTDLEVTGLYKLYKGGDIAEATLFEVQNIAPEIGESIPLLDDKNNPDYLGQIEFKHDDNPVDWYYSEGILSLYEQRQVVEFIRNTNVDLK